MLDPNSQIFRDWQDLMVSGEFVGRNRPVGRVTFVEPWITRNNSTSRPGPWRSQLFNPAEPVWLENWVELSVRSISISRSIGQDAATCTLSMVNVRPGQYVRQGIDEDPFGVGYLTPYRGMATAGVSTSVYGDEHAETTWGYAPNDLSNQLLPNTLVRTYQGYGSDNFDENGHPRDPSDPLYVSPANDSKLVLTGVWLIDRATFVGGTESPTINVECRDLGKLLIEQFIFPKMIPMSRFPLVYSPIPDTEADQNGQPASAGRNTARYDTSAPDQHSYYPNGAVSGHKGTDAFDGREETYWLSHSYEHPSSSDAYEWLQADCDGDEINEVYIHTVKSGYTVYVSVKEDGTWKGSNSIPYTPGDHNHNAGIDYVAKSVIGSSAKVKIKLPRTYKAEKVRITFHNLQEFTGLPYFPYRVAVREFHCYMRSTAIDWNNYVFDNFPPAAEPGQISDWSEAIKELCGWAGFTWPDASPNHADPLLGICEATGTPMRIWGDFEVLGSGPIISTPGDYFMNKSFMEAIRQIVDFLGGIFYIDHTGGAQFRMPNIWAPGNFVCDVDSVSLAARTNTHPIEFNDGINLLGYTMTLDDSQIRSEIVVVGKDPDIKGEGMVAGGFKLGNGSAIDFSDLLNGQVRLMMIPGESTKNFKTNAECAVMAELTAVQIMMTYRKGSAQIIAHPGLHIDDQVRIFERVTNETAIHYVSGIESSMDLESGEYTMNVTTHWLGTDAANHADEGSWVIDAQKLTPTVQLLPVILKRLAASNTAGTGDLQPANAKSGALGA